MADNSCTLAIIGDGSVGKSTIVSAFRTNGFQSIYKQTIGCDFHEKQLTVRANHTVSLRVWDIGGQSIHSKNLRTYLETTKAIMLVYDVTNSESFANLDDWLTQLRKYNTTKYIYLLGNKVDMIAQRQVTEKQHNSFIENYGLRGGNFCSAKTGENIVRMFYQISAEIIGIKLTEYELAFHDKVLTAHIQSSSGGKEEVRNTWADDIEREDMEAEKRKNTGENAGCVCVIT